MDPLAGDASRIDTKRQIRSRKIGNGTKRLVRNTILRGETESMDHIHVCDACVSPCDDPESQMDVSIGKKDGFFSPGGIGT